ncbi:MAG TPA: glycosyltransferase family 2 protein [Bauldia sp.]|nr:glycosyltransferase family 2 protein [Bauldia sp.]
MALFSALKSAGRRGIGPAGVVLVGLSSLAAAVAASHHIFSADGVPAFSKAVYLFLFCCLFLCAFAYQLTRLGASIRRQQRAPRDAGPAVLLSPSAPAVTVLVPTLREERRVLQMTVLSAALTRYGRRNVVVLVDDPPQSNSRLRTLEAVEEVRRRLAEPMRTLRTEVAQADRRQALGVSNPICEISRIALLYDFAADWLEELAENLGQAASREFAHVDSFFVDDIVLGLASTYRRRGAALVVSTPTAAQVAAEYDRLASLFCDDIAVFERKTFANLSHAANKAMNLNSYIGLAGGNYGVREANGARYLEKAGGEAAAIHVSDAEYFLTLDADSVVRPNYLLELVEIAEATPQAGVVQTPYLTFPQASSTVERIAGATTDIQYLVHQGSSFFGAAHWVGANALLRKTALDSIRVTEHDGTAWREIFIQDRTVIEDTGSTMDLLARGWGVYNHFKPLAFSATPADFGSLAIQRQRWSNGGLIIFPSLWRQYWRSPGRIARLPEFFLRSHYLLSPLVGNLAVLMLMVLLLADARQLLVAALAMGPYFLLYGWDLRRIGYRFRDIVAVSALNLMLLPVSLAGVLASIVQMATGRKAAFARTPKVAGRTAVHPVYILFNAGMLGLMIDYTVAGIEAGDLAGIVVPAVNVVLYGYGLQRFIGLKAGVLDLLRPLGRRSLEVLRGVAGQLAFGPRSIGAFSVTRTAVAVVLALIATLVPVSFRSTITAASDGHGSEAVAGTAAFVPVTATLRLERAADPELSAQGGKLE